jgi:hypothetical protein
VKKPTLTSSKKKAWDAFSKYIRLRDCLETTGTKEEGLCFTCGARKMGFKGKYCLQAGHFLSGRGNSILFEEDGCHAQDVQCNYYKAGNPEVYRVKMVEKYGLERVEELEVLKKQTKNYTIEEYQEIEGIYKDKFRKLYDANR